jgi:hypothetical protein
VLLGNVVPSGAFKENSEKILQQFSVGDSDWKIGKTLVFMTPRQVTLN